MNPTVSFVIVNYNGRPFIRECLDSALSQSRRPDEVIVIDNASADESVLLIQEYPEVKLIALPVNTGYAAACNRGIDESKGELIAILNNDIILDRCWLENLLKHNVDPWGFWASRILFAGDQNRIDSAGDGMAVVGAAYKIGHGDPAGHHEKPREVFGPCAAAALYRRSLLDHIGGFDPDFFLIYEDADLNMRARLQGYRCLFVPEAVVHHRVNATIRTFSYNYVFYGHRNSEYVFWKNMPSNLLIRYLPERTIFNLFSFVFFSAKGQSGAFLRAKVDFLRNFSKVLEKRKQIQSNRRISAREFQHFLDRNWIKYRRKWIQGQS